MHDSLILTIALPLYKKGYMIPFHAHHYVFPWALIFPRIVNPREFELEKG
jgi:hypothetical protein